MSDFLDAEIPFDDEPKKKRKPAQGSKRSGKSVRKPAGGERSEAAGIKETENQNQDATDTENGNPSSDEFPSSVMVVLPGCVWTVLPGDQDESEPSVRTELYSVSYGYSVSPAVSRYYWPDFEQERGVLSYAFFQDGVKGKPVRGWNSYLATGALVYAIKKSGDAFGKLRILMPGSQIEQKAVIESFDRISKKDEASSIHPRLADSNNGQPERVVSEIASFIYEPMAFVENAFVACSDENNSFYAMHAPSGFDEIEQWIGLPLVGDKQTYELREKLNVEQATILTDKAGKMHTKIAINDNEIEVSPFTSMKSWLKKSWNK